MRHTIGAAIAGMLLSMTAVSPAAGDDSKPPERIECEDQRVFLRREVTEVPLTMCSGLRPKSDGAAFSFVDDREGGATALSSKAGLGFVVVSPGSFAIDRSADRAALALDDLALMVFAEAHGQLGTDGGDDGYARAGLKLESVFSGGPFSKLGVSVLPYRQSDISADGAAYGVQASAVPQMAGLPINVAIGPKDSDTSYHFLLHLVADAFAVEDPGDSELEDGDEYGWLGGRLGLEYSTSSLIEHGVTAFVLADLYRDVIGARTAAAVTAGVDFNLMAGGATALGIEYTRGKSRQDLELEDKVSLTFKVKY